MKVEMVTRADDDAESAEPQPRSLEGEDESEHDDTVSYQMVSPRWWSAQRLAGILFCLLAVFAVLALRGVPVGGLSRPGPSLWPLAVSAFTFGAGAVLLLIPNAATERFTLRGLIRSLSLLLAMFAFPALYPLIGMIIPMALIVVYMMVVLSAKKWWVALIVGVTSAVLVYLLFGQVLGVRLSPLW